jgi:putative nucleotidyltransferase with HDIG domain
VSLSLDHEDLVQSAYRLPPLPQSATRLTSLLAEDVPDSEEIVKVIEFDSTLTLKMLRVANSAIGGSRHRIGTVRQALIRMGPGIVAGFVVGSCVRPLTGKQIPGYNIPEAEFWRHSLAAAFAAAALQRYCNKAVGPLAFTAALLHDIGKLVLGQYLNAEMLSWLDRAVKEGKQEAYEAEAEILSLHHGDVGGIIAQHWGLPESLMKALIYHHQPQDGAEAICYLTFLANRVAHRLEPKRKTAERSPESPATDEVGPALEWLGLTEQNLVNVGETVLAQLGAASAPIG